MRGRKTLSAPKAVLRTLYMLELARGCSHIRSALTHDKRIGAISEVLQEFRDINGDSELPVFQQLLEEELRRRDCGDMASAVRSVRSPRVGR